MTNTDARVELARTKGTLSATAMILKTVYNEDGQVDHLVKFLTEALESLESIDEHLKDRGLNG